MAIVTRYFSTASAGAANGTTWADRAVLFSAGAWNTIITGFDFVAGANSLKCLIGPGTHTITVAMAAGLFANPPTAANLLFMHGCDSSGNQLTPPDEDWVSAQPAWDDSGLPVIATTTNTATGNLTNCLWRLIKFTASGRTSAGVLMAGTQTWCSLVNSTNNSSTIGISGSGVQNSLISMTGDAYSAALTHATFGVFNCRLSGVAGSSGNRYGLNNTGSGTAVPAVGVTAIGFGGAGAINTGTSIAHILSLIRCSFIGNGGSGILLPSTASQTVINIISGCLCTGNTLWGLDAQSAARVLCLHNRFRDNTSGNVNGLLNYPEFDSETTDTDDATEFVDSAGGDYRIKNTAATWGRGFGAGDQAAAGGGGGAYIIGGG